MARLPRLSVGGCPHLVIHRGHNRQAVFIDDADRQSFRNMLGEAARANAVALHAYGLFDDQLRLLATPTTDESLSQMMQALGRRYGAYFNRRYDRTGGLWDGRFRATVIDPERHLLSCMRFVEEADAPEGLAAGILPTRSSAAHHLGKQADSLVSDHSLFWSLGNTPFEREAAYGRLLQRPLPAAERERLEAAALKGWPVGDANFIGALEGKTDRRLQPLARGRPAKGIVKSDPN